MLVGCPNGSSSTPSNDANTVVGHTADPAYNFTIGQTGVIPVTFTTNTGTATNLSVTNLSSLPAGWTKQGGGTSFSCANVASSGSGCTLNLNYAPTNALASTTLTLNYAYTNAAGSNTMGEVSIPYSALVMGYGFIVNSGANDVSQCSVGFNGALYTCSNNLAGYTLDAPNGVKLTTINGNSYAYFANKATSSIAECNVTNGELTGCNSTPSSSLNEPSTLAIQTFSNTDYLYATNQGSDTSIAKCTLGNSGSISVCIQQLASSFIAPTGITFYTTASATTLAYITDATNNSVSICSMGPNGDFNSCNAQLPTSVTTPISIVQKTFNNIPYLYVTNANGSIAKLKLNTTTGNITADVVVTGPTVAGFNTIAFQSANGTHYAYVTNRSDDTVYQCTVNNTDGDLSDCALINTSPALNLNAPVGIDFLNVSGA